jgi:GMP synthase (glutamine-hydrolysing)
MSFAYVLQHTPSETAGAIAVALRGRKIVARVIKSFSGDEVPREIGDARALIVMGGPMGVYEADAYPFLKEEKRLIERALRADVPVLGVCLGSQLLASVLGAHVTRGHAKEIGWIPVEFSASAGRDRIFGGVSSPIVPLQWHGDVFTLPAGAVSLAKSAMTRCQAFRYGRAAYGVLFHLEVTRGIVAKMVRAFAGELAEQNIAREDVLAGAAKHLPRLEPIARGVFERFAAHAAGTAPEDVAPRRKGVKRAAPRSRS